MDLSALDKALVTIESHISGVERHVDSLEKWLWLSSVAVIIGVALEVYFVVNQYREGREAWERGFVRPPDRPSKWLLAVEVASIILVVAGIAGELGIGILSSNANAKLRTLNNSRLGLVRQKATDAIMQAGDARLSAGQAADAAASAVDSSSVANREAANAKAVARGAREEADSFEKAINEAKTDAGEAKALLSEVRQLAADAENRAANAERKVADRHITPTQLDRIHKSLPRWSGQDIRLSIVSVNGDGEMWTYGQELLSAFGSIPGWSIMLTAVGRNNGVSGLSIRIGSTPSELDKALASALVNALHDAGVQANGPEPAPPYGAMTSGGGYFVSGVFNPKDPKFDPKAVPNQNVSIEIGQKK